MNKYDDCYFKTEFLLYFAGRMLFCLFEIFYKQLSSKYMDGGILVRHTCPDADVHFYLACVYIYLNTGSVSRHSEATMNKNA